MIRLLKLDAGNNICLETFGDNSIVPIYAILSHTWSRNAKDELSYVDLIERRKGTEHAGYRKVYAALQQAIKDDIAYCWVDTCCIDKTNSQELSEAIVSMFRWYERASKCYAYLSDVFKDDPVVDFPLAAPGWMSRFRDSKWFTRGWTLQELLAPSVVEFFSREWDFLGDKKSMDEVVHQITGIPVEVLRFQKPLARLSVEERMSWANLRETARPEDQSYCLFGILDVYFHAQYGIGKEKAYRLLTEAIEKADQQCESRSSKRLKPTIERSLDNKQIEILLKSLRFDEIEERRSTIKTAHPNTCRWLLKDPQYIAWSKVRTQHEYDNNSLLWIKGKPGSGKSTIMKFALENSRRASQTHISLAFFFNARGSRLEKTVVGAYRSLLLQLLEQMPSLQSIFQEVLGVKASIIESEYDWNIGSLQDLLLKALISLEDVSVVCFIDALDECDEADIRDMIWFLDDICQQLTFSTRIHIRICFASRHYPHITIPRGLELILDSKEGHQQDIIDYLATKLRIGRTKYGNSIRTQVLKKASGVFIWVVLVVQILNREYDRGNGHFLQQKLAKIPDGIYELFLSILTRASDQANEVTKLCVQWVLFAREPMTVRQLYYAIRSGTDDSASFHSEFASSIDEIEGINSEDDSYNNDQANSETGNLNKNGKNDQISDDNKEDDDANNGDKYRFLLHQSKGLIELTRSGKPKVQFIHESVRDFLLKEKGFSKIWPGRDNNIEGRCQERLKQCCISYIHVPHYKEIELDNRSLSNSSKQANDRCEHIEHIEAETSFLRYVQQNMFYHADQASKHNIQQTEFLQDSKTLLRWLKLKNLLERFEVRKYPIDTSLLYILADTNSPNLISEHPDIASYLRLEKGRYGTPLFAALAQGNKAAIIAFLEALIVKMCLGDDFRQLVKQYSDCSDWQGGFGIGYNFPKRGSVPSQFTASVNDVLFDFVSRATPSFLNTDNIALGTYMMTATRLRDSRGFSRLIKLGMDTNVIGDSVFNHVQRDQRHEVIKCLLESGADIDRVYASLLSIDPNKWSLDIVQLLLQHGADVNAQGGGYGTALQNASLHGRSDIVQLLLQHGADVNAQGGVCGNALQAASLCGSLDIVQLLLQHGADVNTQGGAYGNALQAASRPDIVQLLLQHGADVNAQ